MPDMVKVLFQFEDTPEARRTLAAALEDPAWESHHERPTLDIGFGMMEHHALFILTQAASQYGAKLLVVPAPAKAKLAPAKQIPVQEEDKPKEMQKLAKQPLGPKAVVQSKTAPAKKESK